MSQLQTPPNLRDFELSSYWRSDVTCDFRKVSVDGCFCLTGCHAAHPEHSRPYDESGLQARAEEALSDALPGRTAPSCPNISPAQGQEGSRPFMRSGRHLLDPSCSFDLNQHHFVELLASLLNLLGGFPHGILQTSRVRACRTKHSGKSTDCRCTGRHPAKTCSGSNTGGRGRWKEQLWVG